MKLTNPEKLIINMLAKLHENAGIEVDTAKFIQEAIYMDQTWALSWQLSGIVGDDTGEPPAHVRPIMDIFDMWSFIEASIKKLDPVELADVRSKVGGAMQFIGYDGNNETELMATASFIVNDMGRFSEFAGRDMNSHMPTFGRYMSMYEVFEPMRSSLGYDSFLSKANLIELLSI